MAEIRKLVFLKNLKNLHSSVFFFGIFSLFGLFLSLNIVSAEYSESGMFNVSEEVFSAKINESPKEIALSYDEKFLYALTVQNSVFVIELSSGDVFSIQQAEELPFGLLHSSEYKGYRLVPNPIGDSVSIVCINNGETKKEFNVGSSPVGVSIGKKVVYIALKKDREIKAFSVKSIFNKDVPKCSHGYSVYFFVALIGIFVSFFLFVYSVLNRISLVKEEKGLARFIVEHLEKGHHIKDIHFHLTRHVHKHKVHKAVIRAAKHIHHKKSGKKSKLL